MTFGKIKQGRYLVAFAAVCILVAGCSYTPLDPRNTNDLNDNENTDFKNRKTIFGDGGFNFLGDDDNKNDGNSLGVNSFLWRASLETISFMPINTADAFGGVILTDWYSPPESPSERFKLNVYILGRTLRADGVKVSVFRQLRDRSGAWADSTVPDGTAPKVEDSILTKARMLRHQTLTSK